MAADESVKAEGVRVGKPGEPAELPPYHNAETYKIAQQRAAEIAAKQPKADGEAK